MSAKGQQRTSRNNLHKKKDRLAAVSPLKLFRLLFDSTDARWAARDLDLAGHLQRLAVEAQHVERLVEHGLRQQRLTILAPNHPLPPTPNLRLGRECELVSLDAVDHDEAVIVVGLMGFRLVRAVLDHHRHVRAIGREGYAFGDLSDRERLYDTG